MEINKIKGIAERKLDHMRHGCFRGSLNHFIETGTINGSFLEAINSLITECEGKADSTSGKDLRVCEVIASAYECLPEWRKTKIEENAFPYGDNLSFDECEKCKKKHNVHVV